MAQWGEVFVNYTTEKKKKQPKTNKQKNKNKFYRLSKGSLLSVWLLCAGSNEPHRLNAEVLVCRGGFVALSIYQTTLPMLPSLHCQFWKTGLGKFFALCNNLCLILQHCKYLFLKHSLIYWNGWCYWQVQIVNYGEAGERSCPTHLRFAWCVTGSMFRGSGTCQFVNSYPLLFLM